MKEDRSVVGRPSLHQTNEREAPSRHLWVGNVSASVTEAELAEQFSRFGDIESITAYPSRNYAFVNLKTVEDGLYAKKGLQGTILGGMALRIEFAKGAKPSKHLWIGNISSSVTKEQLEAEFKRFGSLEDVRILRERNCAFVDFTRTDDAVAAFENMNKKLFGTEELCVEYVKSQLHLKKDTKSEERPSLQEAIAKATAGLKPAFDRSRNMKDEPSEILWVGFPICMKIDERKLHKAFSPFGLIERITTFPGRTYAFVQFQTIKAATRAKNVLQGKLFNDPRVSISFAKSEIGPTDHHTRASGSWMSSTPSNTNLPPLLFSKPPGYANPRNDRFLGSNNFRPQSPNVWRHPDGDMKDSGLLLQASHNEGSFGDDGARGMWPRSDMNMWGNPALPEGAFVHSKHLQEERWNFNNESSLDRREPRRPLATGNPSDRIGSVDVRSPEPRDDRNSFEVVKAQDYISKVANIGKPPRDNWEDFEALKRPTKRPALSSNTDIPRPVEGNWNNAANHLKEGFRWQGVIAKSGTAVCQAQCFSIGNTFNFVFPEVVNCTARTSLDMLAKHISEVGEFSLVAFVPHGELDVESYQEFIRYLSEKSRAAVCKLSQESILFLVPPSSFVEHFLKAPTTNKIVGVLLKVQQPSSSSSTQATSFQHMQTGVNVFPVSTPQPLLEQKLPVATSTQAVIHGTKGEDTLLLPQSSSFEPSRSNYQSSGDIPSAGGLNASFAIPNVDDGQLAHMHFSTGYVSAQQQKQQSLALPVGGFNLTATKDSHLHQEINMRVNPSLSMPTNNQSSTNPLQYTQTQMQMNLVKNDSQTSAPYPQQPPLPQYPHPSAQQKQPAQLAQITSLNVQTAHPDQFSQFTPHSSSQLQQFSDNLQADLQSQTALGSHLHHQSKHQMGDMSNFSQNKDQWPAIQQSNPPSAGQIGVDTSRTQTTADGEQHELIRLAQQKLSEAKGGSGEDSKRFQATLELAAALLQQLQQRAK
ncbi:hypothetical protein KP509_11G013200 [Ceratopteris richardii]|nr:hypothetical protein KP509_11G013200 [Ceratopteris richardii]KAH7424541.1 hypothetical protein KP509_11G013200 [Ceratopteris richardii]